MKTTKSILFILVYFIVTFLISIIFCITTGYTNLELTFLVVNGIIVLIDFLCFSFRQHQYNKMQKM